MRVDAAVSAEALRVISPLAMEAALAAMTDRERVGTDRIAQLELALEQARLEAARAGRQYNAVEPENRIVASELERRWNERLGEVARLAERGELDLREAAAKLGVSKMTVIRLIKDNVLPARQSCHGGPYVIRQEDLQTPAIRRAVSNGHAVPPDPRQKSLQYQ